MRYFSLLRTGVLITMLIIPQACSNVNQPSNSAAPADTAPLPSVSETSSAPAEETASAEPEWDTETLRNDTGKTMIKSMSTQSGKHIAFAIVSSQGTVIMADPHGIPSKNGLLRADVITSTFINHDHQDMTLIHNNPDARVSEMKAESFTVKDVQVTGIAASHTGEPIDTNQPDDVIYVYEVDGLRIAYFAGLDQEQLTEEQLKQLGTIDIALVAFKHVPAWHVKKEVAIMILNALKPRIVLPTEFDADTAEEIRQLANVKDSGEQDFLTVSADDLKSMTGTQSIFIQPMQQ